MSWDLAVILVGFCLNPVIPERLAYFKSDTGKYLSSHRFLWKMFFVGSTNKAEVELTEIENENLKFNILHDAMHRQYLRGMGCGFSQLKLTAQIMSTISATQVLRIQKESKLEEMLDLIEEDIKK